MSSRGWWHLNDCWRSITIFKIEAEPVKSRVEIPSVQHTTLHRLLDVFSLEVELLQSRVQVLQAQTRQSRAEYNRSICVLTVTSQRDDAVFTSNFLLVSLPDMGPLSPFSSLKSLISLMIFFSRSAWIETCVKGSECQFARYISALQATGYSCNI